MKRILKLNVLSVFIFIMMVLLSSQTVFAYPSGVSVYDDSVTGFDLVEDGDRLYLVTPQGLATKELFFQDIEGSVIDDGLDGIISVQASLYEKVVVIVDGTTIAEGNPMIELTYDYYSGSVFIDHASFEETYSWTGTRATIYFEGLDASPVISGQTAFVTNVDSPLSEEDIRSYISVWDETDGDITHLVEVQSDTYTANMNTVGTYSIVYSVQDYSGNEATLTVSVLVRDVTKPTWDETKGTVQVSYTQTFDIEAYKSQLGIVDNYDSFGDLTITVESNTYTANKTNPGLYTIIYSVEDTSGNSIVAEVEIEVIDNVSPVFSGPETIAKPNNQVLLVSDILAQLTANDAVEGNLTSSIQVSVDDYTGNGHLVGDYEIRFYVEDAYGNYAEHLVTVSVYDDLPPIFFVKDNYFITVEQSVSLSIQQIIDILEITGQLDASGTGGVELYTLVNEYEGNETVVGIYAVSLRAVSPSGSSSVYNVAIEVFADESDEPITIDEDQEWYQPVIDLWHSVWTWITLHILESIGIGIALIGVVVFLISLGTKGSKKYYYQNRK